jgi:hypothetical protein
MRKEVFYNKRSAQDSLQAFLIYRHLDSYVWEIIIDLFIGTWRTGRIILGILMVLGNGTDRHGNILDELKTEKLLACPKDCEESH